MIILLIRLHQDTQVHVITNMYKTKHRERGERGREGGREGLREGGGRKREVHNVYAVINYTHTNDGPNLCLVFLTEC